MRVKQYELIQQMLELMDKVHKKLEDIITLNKQSDYLESLSNMLVESQGLAIKIGNIVEESEGESQKLIGFLEDYCELIYLVNEELNNTSEDENDIDRLCKKTRKIFLKIKNSVKHDISVTREVVFLPYKASMWDSLESVWKAADSDPNCNAIVIPIPYYDKNPDGSVRAEYYEADLFPEYVPITDYSEYDFGKRNPDVVFIHNPYDYGNLVTTIHPFFYAENMKKVTDCLVYIPYFATSGAMSESRSWCPVYEYVDYIVIQAESYRKYYSPNIPDEKFIAFGSPKFDNVINKCKKNMVINDEWRAKIENKRVFFYNTSLNGMLVDTPQFMRKMQYVFDTFKNHPECCLLWRPHPLFESTLYAMRPECVEVFDALKKDFLKQDNWIYDETPCAEDTIAICDGYIGDNASSIVALFGVVGKPIFIVDNRIDEETKNELNKASFIEPIKAHDGYNQEKISVISNDELYMEENGEYNFKFELSEFSRDYLRMLSYTFNERIFIFPYIEQEILIVNGTKIEKVELNHEDNVEVAFIDYEIRDNCVFLFPFQYSSIVKYNMETGRIDYIRGVRDFCVFDRRRKAIWCDDDNLYVLKGNGNEYLKIKLDLSEITTTRIDINDKYTNAYLSPNEKSVWLTSYGTKKLLYWNYDNQIIKDYSISNTVEFDSIKDIIFVDNEMYVVPNSGTKIYPIKDINKAVDIGINLQEEPLNGTLKPDCYSQGKFIYDGEKYSYLSPIDGCLYDLYGLKMKKRKVIFNIKNELKFKRLSRGCGYCCKEDLIISLDRFINEYDSCFDKDEQIKDYENINASPDGDCGEKVYNFLSKEKR